MFGLEKLGVSFDRTLTTNSFLQVFLFGGTSSDADIKNNLSEEMKEHCDTIQVILNTFYMALPY